MARRACSRFVLCCVTLAEVTSSGKGLWSRWVLVGAVLIMAASLLLTVWVTYRGVDAASEALVRGQAVSLQADLREEFRGRAGEIAEADLLAIHQNYATQGLRYIALIKKRHAVIAVGTPVLGDHRLQESIERARKGEFFIHDGVVRLFLRARPRRGDGRGARRPPPIYVEFEPREAKALRASSTRSLAIGTGASALLLGLAIFMGRLFARQDRERVQHEENRRLSSLGQMSAVLAHEIRNPLTSLKGNAQLLESMLGKNPDTSAKIVSKAQRVVNEATRLEHLIADLLDFARTGALTREATDPARLLRESAAQLGAEDLVVIESAEAPASFPLDVARMQQVLCNLLQNAVETQTVVQASVCQRLGKLVYRVRDHGEGIDPSAGAALFEPFHTTKTHGTGLGLAVAKRIVELHGGTIAAHNAQGGGAEFVVELPVTANE